MATKKLNTISKFLDILKFERSEIYAIYFYAIMAGVVQLTLPLGIQAIISFVMGGTISTSLVVLIIAVIIGVFCAGLLQVNQMKIIEKIQQQLFVRYSFQYANNIPKLNLQKVSGYYLPELVNRFFDTMLLQKGIGKLLLDIPAASIQIIFGLILLSFYHPVFIAFGLLLLAILYLILRLTGNRGMQSSLEESNYKYNVAGYLQELARTVLSFKFSRNREMHLYKTDVFVTGYLQSRTSHFRILQFQYWTLIVFKLAITSAMLIVGAFLLVDQQLNIGQFIAAEIVILMVIGSVEKLIINLDSVYDVLTAVEKITKVTEKELEENGTKQLEENDTGLSISLSNLSFEYEPGQPVLQNINLDIKGGEKICIMGLYSSGKSTLLRLLTGAYKEFSGTFKINGIPLHHYDINSIRMNTGIQLNIQDIFHGTIRENICLGDDSSSDVRLDELAALTGLKSFIEAHKEGYEFLLQPTGQHLSGRVIRRILFLRAIISSPKLLLLEEPWLGLEDKFAGNIKNYLTSLGKSQSVVVVTNDREYARNCDRVFVLEKGSLNEINV